MAGFNVEAVRPDVRVEIGQVSIITTYLSPSIPGSKIVSGERHSCWPTSGSLCYLISVINTLPYAKYNESGTMGMCPGEYYMHDEGDRGETAQ